MIFLDLIFGSPLTFLIVAFLFLVSIIFSVGMVRSMMAERRRTPRRDTAKGLRRVLFVSEFKCRSCGRSFEIYENRDRVPFCQECGHPDPEHIITMELREELRFKPRKLSS